VEDSRELSSSSTRSGLEAEPLDAIGGLRILIDVILSHALRQAPAGRPGGLGSPPQPLEANSGALFAEAAEVGPALFELLDLLEQRGALRRERDHLAWVASRHRANVSLCCTASAVALARSFRPQRLSRARLAPYDARAAVTPSCSSIRPSNSAAPPLDSGSLRFPHLGD